MAITPPPLTVSFDHDRQFATNLGRQGWDANLACKCLHKCSYDAYEALSLAQTCEWDDDKNLAHDINKALFADLEDGHGVPELFHGNTLGQHGGSSGDQFHKDDGEFDADGVADKAWRVASTWGLEEQDPHDINKFDGQGLVDKTAGADAIRLWNAAQQQ